MDSIRESELRRGNFTSSGIGNLFVTGRGPFGFGKAALEYIMEKNFERQLKLPIDSDIAAKPFSWGKACEKILFDKLPTSYKLISQETIQHPEIPFWVGSPDAIKEEEDFCSAPELKCPITRKSYMQFYQCNNILEVRENHPYGEHYFQQANSNFILLQKNFPEKNWKYCELIVFMPYKSELPEIRSLCNTSDYFSQDQLYKYLWIYNALDEELPYVLDGGLIKNIKTFRWEVTEQMKTELTSKIVAAGNLLINQ